MSEPRPRDPAGARHFVAVGFDEAITEAIAAAARAWLPRDWQRVRPELIHLTLRFLGEADAEQVAAAQAALDRASSGVAPFELTLCGWGAFPDAKRARVAWLGVEAPPVLGEWVAALEHELVAAGLPGEPRAFSAHVTVARRHGRPVALALPRGRAEPIATVTVTGATLLRSEASPSGQRYVSIGATALARRA